MTASDSREPSKDSDSPRLRFKGVEDARDFARHSVEQSRRWLVANRVDMRDLYRDSKLEVVVRLLPVPNAGYKYLVFRAVPSGRECEGAAEREDVAFFGTDPSAESDDQ